MTAQPQNPEIANAGAMALERLREQRARPQRARLVADDFKALGATLVRDARRYGAVGALWSELCPAQYVDRTRVAGFSRGVLQIEAMDASTRYAIDRALRGGLQERIVGSSRSAVRRVRVQLPR